MFRNLKLHQKHLVLSCFGRVEQNTAPGKILYLEFKKTYRTKERLNARADFANCVKMASAKMRADQQKIILYNPKRTINCKLSETIY